MLGKYPMRSSLQIQKIISNIKMREVGQKKGKILVKKLLKKVKIIEELGCSIALLKEQIVEDNPVQIKIEEILYQKIKI